MDTRLPHHIDMELELLGMLILKEGKAVPQVAAILKPEDFYSYEHQLIFSAILDLYRNGTPPNMPSIADWLKRKNYIFKGEGNAVSPYDKVSVDTISALGQVAFTTAFAESYALKIKDASNRDKLVRLGISIQENARDLTKDFSTLVIDAENAFRDITGNATQQKFIPEFSYFANSILADINKNKLYSKRKTGFDNIDSFQIFSPGLYVIGATPAAGKTTFCWQLLRQLAKNGEVCVFCSYEMSALELYSKTLSQELFLRNRKTSITAADIRSGSHSEELESIMIELACNKDLNGVNVFELCDESIDDLIRLLRPFCTDKNKSPVVCLDYLQIVPPSNDQRLNSDKIRIDDIVHKLKTFQRETNTTFIVVSSFNRLNYYQQVSFESFKESGNIEYTADVVWALQLNVANQIKMGASISDTRQKFDNAKRQQPRHIQLKCLKNRQGQNYECFFNYYSAHDYFEPCDGFNDAEYAPGGNFHMPVVKMSK